MTAAGFPANGTDVNASTVCLKSIEATEWDKHTEETSLKLPLLSSNTEVQQSVHCQSRSESPEIGPPSHLNCRKHFRNSHNYYYKSRAASYDNSHPHSNNILVNLRHSFILLIKSSTLLSLLWNIPHFKIIDLITPQPRLSTSPQLKSKSFNT